MEDLQLNISIPKNVKKSPVSQDKSPGYKFLTNPNFSGKTLARKRPKNLQQHAQSQKVLGEPVNKVSKTDTHNIDISANLRDLSENKGKYQGKNYQELSDNIQLKQKPRSGGWISSLFKNNPDVPHVGQRAVKPLVEKVFAGKTFSDLDIHPHSIANLQQNLNLKELMTVQQKAIPILLQGRDVLIRSQTGSGKTLAYALPIIEGLQAIRPKISRHDGIRVIVVIPTRELAVQTYELFVKLVKPFTWIVPGLLSGGQKRKAEKARLRKGLSILVGTPGRINDHLRHTQSLNFAKTGCLVLDEADRLLDMGYEKDVAAIVKAIDDHKKAATYDPMALIKQTVKKTFPEEDEIKNYNDKESITEIEAETIKHNLTKIFLSTERQSILLSATLTKAVENLAGITMVDPVFVDTSEGRVLVADSLKTKSDSKLNTAIPENTKIKVSDESTHSITYANNDIEDKDHDAETSTSRRGLKAFCGVSHLDLFTNDETNNVDNANNVVAKNCTEDSDSDSDYEYFKVQKELEVKNTEVDNCYNTEEITTLPDTSNIFDDAVKIAINEDELILPASVNQTFIVVPMKLRLVTLCALIVEKCVLNKKGGKMIVFMATLEMVDYHADLIEYTLSGEKNKAKKSKDINKKSNTKKRKADKSDSEEIPSEDSDFEVDYEIPAEGGLVPMAVEMFKLHGSMPHNQRMEVFKQFRAARNGVLICTDVAARGIDVPRVDLVVQYCAPSSATDYVHRVGRTGRATQIGAAILFLLPSEVEFVRYLEKRRIRLRQSDESAPLAALVSVVPAATSAHRAAIAVQTRLEALAHTDKDWLARASRAYTSWVRFYAGYPREVREWLDSRQLHLGHAAKAFALRDTPAALARRAKSDSHLKREAPANRLTVHEEQEKKRPGFPKLKGIGSMGSRASKQSSMHTASEFDSGLPPLPQTHKKKRNK